MVSVQNNFVGEAAGITRKVLTKEELASIESLGRKISRPAGTNFCSQGQLDHNVFVVLSGSVEIVVHSSAGSTMTVGRRGPGELVGEMAALDGQPRSASIVAAEPVQLIVLGQAAFFEVLKTHPTIAIDLLVQVAQRLRDQTYRHASRSNLLRARVARQLLALSEDRGSNKIKTTQVELASWVDATRESTSKALKSLRELGVIKTSRGVIDLVNPEELAALADEE